MRLHPASQSTHVFPTLVAKALDAATWESFIFQVDADDDFDDDAHCWCWWWWWWSAQAPGHLLPDRLWLWFSRAQDRGHPPHHHHHHLHPHFDLKVKSISFYTFSSLQFHWLGYSPQKSCFVGTLTTIALCGYPIGKMEIRDSSQISTTAPIFVYYDYFRQNIWANILVQFHFQYIFGDDLTAYTIWVLILCLACREHSHEGTSWTPASEYHNKYF